MRAESETRFIRPNFLGDRMGRRLQLLVGVCARELSLGPPLLVMLTPAVLRHARNSEASR